MKRHEAQDKVKEQPMIEDVGEAKTKELRKRIPSMSKKFTKIAFWHHFENYEHVKAYYRYQKQVNNAEKSEKEG